MMYGVPEELPSLHELLPEAEGPVFEWQRQMWLSTTREERGWMEEGMVVRMGIRTFELQEATNVPGVGICYLIRVFRTHLTDAELAALSSR